jgi:Na+-translocating ferredoxin:NAD+ oxidoreductase RnfC subunit
MRAIAYGALDSIENGKIVFGCCDCGLCTQYACPMGLSPSRFITAVKQGLGKKGIKPEKTYSDGVSPTRDKVPTERLMQRLGIAGYTAEAPLSKSPVEVRTVRIKLSQHIGAPAEAIVKEGDTVTVGSLIGRMPEGKLSANVHASINGKVTAVTPDYIEIQG